MIVRGTRLRASVRVMRIICPIMVLLCLSMAVLAARRGAILPACLSSFCVGVNLILSWIQWKIFNLKEYENV